MKRPAKQARTVGTASVKRATYRKGLRAESVAAALLAVKGYRILARRFRSGVGEVDLIARRGRRLAFVEVKTRATAEAAVWSVTPRQRRRIARGAEAWLSRNPHHLHCDMAFDVVLVAPRAWPRHLKDAFRV